MPGPAHFQGMEEGGVDDAVEIGFTLGGEAGVEFCFFPLNGDNPNPGRKMKIQTCYPKFLLVKNCKDLTSKQPNVFLALHQGM